MKSIFVNQLVFLINTKIKFSFLRNFLEPESTSKASTDKLVHYVGDSATLSGCHFVSNFTNGISVSWLKNGEVFRETSFTNSWNSHSFLISVDALNISNLDFDDSGNYSCQLSYAITNNKKTLEAPSVSLTVQSRYFFALST